eukprot:TRINITY_DN47711_c0_g1_i1.p1 TRINITY_DN47711_c0_g1~~TRINITY_DN47711_c0_g1_i1.p1  ORF type:complete len:719 (+),score=103.48 TRINITY_DN47711_c0_g1_i1:57-2213(+)
MQASQPPADAAPDAGATAELDSARRRSAAVPLALAAGAALATAITNALTAPRRAPAAASPLLPVMAAGGQWVSVTAGGAECLAAYGRASTGHQLVGMRLTPDPAACCLGCAEEPACEGWQYNASTHSCWLLHTPAGTRAQEGSVLGARAAAGPRPAWLIAASPPTGAAEAGASAPAPAPVPTGGGSCGPSGCCAPPLGAPAPQGLDPPAIAGVCADNATLAQGGGYVSGAPGRVMCTDRRGVVLRTKAAVPLTGTTYLNSLATWEHRLWWKECAHTGMFAYPPLEVPQVVDTVRKGGGGCPAAGHSAVTRLAAASPERSRSDIVMVQISQQRLNETSGFLRWSIAAVALYALAHGYRHLYYTGARSCYMEPVVPKLWPPPPSAAPMCVHKVNCCWQGHFWLRPEWLKPAAMVDALTASPEAHWLVLVDIDAAPRQLGWSVPTAAAYARRHALRISCNKKRKRRCWHNQGVVTASTHQGIVVGREFYASLGKRGARVNTGVMLVDLRVPGMAQVVRDWWASRDDDCKAHCPRNSNPFDCQRNGMYRMWEWRDQSAFGHWVYGRHAKRIAEVPHILINSHAGVVFSHFYNNKYNRNNTELFMREVVARFASQIMRLLCGDAEAAAQHPCAARGAMAGSEAAAHSCGQGWAELWVNASVGAVEERGLMWGNETKIDRWCYRRLVDLVLVEKPQTCVNSKGKRFKCNMGQALARRPMPKGRR